MADNVTTLRADTVTPSEVSREMADMARRPTSLLAMTQQEMRAEQVQLNENLKERRAAKAVRLRKIDTAHEVKSAELQAKLDAITKLLEEEKSEYKAARLAVATEEDAEIEAIETMLEIFDAALSVTKRKRK